MNMNEEILIWLQATLGGMFVASLVVAFAWWCHNMGYRSGYADGLEDADDENAAGGRP